MFSFPFPCFFRLHRMVERSCGQVVESFGYNEHNGRLEETRRSCQRRPTKFTYAKPNSQRVSEYYGAGDQPSWSPFVPQILYFLGGRGRFSIYVDHRICVCMWGKRKSTKWSFYSICSLVKWYCPQENAFPSTMITTADCQRSDSLEATA